MVWARTKLMIHDDLLRPVPKIKVSYEGENPEKFYREVYKLILLSFRISERDIQEKEFHWSKGDPEKFRIKWEVNKDLDKFSYYWIEIELEGHVSRGKGRAVIDIDGAMRTEYPQDTLWQRSLFYEILRMFWHSTFYASKREEYVREGRLLLSSFVNELRVLTRL